MSKRSRKKKPAKPLGSKAQQFAEDLADNEEHMGEMAAMAVTCAQWGIDEEEGYDLLVAASMEGNQAP